jgi:hypothetical protein
MLGHNLSELKSMGLGHIIPVSMQIVMMIIMMMILFLHFCKKDTKLNALHKQSY